MTQSQPQGFLASPPSGNGKPVLVLHAWWGLNDTIKAFCKRLADAGFTAFAPDLYDGKIAVDIPGAKHLRTEMANNSEKDNKVLAEAVRFLLDRVGEPTGRLTVIGFSLGASYALDLAAANPEHIRSVVLFYGTGGGDWSASRAIYLGHFAENDDFEPREEVDNLEKDLAKAGRSVTFHHYPGAGHWFFEPDRVDAYNKQAADLAWNRTLEFLQRA